MNFEEVENSGRQPELEKSVGKKLEPEKSVGEHAKVREEKEEGELDSDEEEDVFKPTDEEWFLAKESVGGIEKGKDEVGYTLPIPPKKRLVIDHVRLQQKTTLYKTGSFQATKFVIIFLH